MKSNLGVNIDHIATVREARKEHEPEVMAALAAAEAGGAFGITMHLRADRRHIQDRDIYLAREIVSTKLNLEMSLDPGIVDIALKVVPEQATLVPENRNEVTTEGGLDVIGNRERLLETVERLRKNGTTVSLFIDPEPEQIAASREVGASYIELHTGSYANATGNEQREEFLKLAEGARLAADIGLGVNAGHGLNYRNTLPIARLPWIEELNIGHAIISRALFCGLEQAVREMRSLIDSADEGTDWPW